MVQIIIPYYSELKIENSDLMDLSLPKNKKKVDDDERKLYFINNVGTIFSVASTELSFVENYIMLVIRR